MNWFLFCILSVFALAAAELIQQYLLNDEKHNIEEKLSGFLTFFLPALLMIPFVIAGYSSSMLAIFSSGTLPYFLGSSFAGSFGTIFYLRSFKVSSISYSTILVASSAIFSTILGILFLNESIDLYKFLGILLILTAIVVSNLNNEKFEKASLWGLAAGIFYGTMYTLDKFIVLEIDPFVYLFWSFLFTSLMLFIRTPVVLLKGISTIKISSLKVILLSGFAYLIYNLFTFVSYTYGGEVGKVDAINNSQIFLIILFETFYLKQKQGIARKVVSFLLAIIGIYILGSN